MTGHISSRRVQRPTTRLRMVIGAIALVSLAACASVTPYQPATNRGGYTDQQLDNNRFRITFEGNTSTDRMTVENYVLYRAAEVALERGFDYFLVLDSDTEAMSQFVTTGSTFGGGGFGRRGFFYGGGFRRGFGGGFATTQSRTSERRSYLAGIIIELRRGDTPANAANAYNARQIVDNLGPIVVRPEQR